jgi:hypothetical protein
MMRTFLSTVLLAAVGVAAAAMPVDYQLVCGEGEDAYLVGVASLVEDQLHVALIDGALETCVDGVTGVTADGLSFSVEYTVEDGVVVDLQVVFEDEGDGAYAPNLTYEELPEVAVEGMLGAQQNRAEAQERAAEARENAEDNAEKNAAENAGPPSDVPGGGDEEGEGEEEGEEPGGPPADLPAPGKPANP